MEQCIDLICSYLRLVRPAHAGETARGAKLMSMHFYTVRRAASLSSRSLTFFLTALLMLSESAIAQVDTNRWTLTAIGIVVVPAEPDPVSQPPLPDPGAFGPGLVTPGNPDSITDCNPLLMDFLGDTEYLGPLFDYLNCATDGTADFLQATINGLDGLSAELSSYAQQLRDYAQNDPAILPNVTTKSVYVCSIETGAKSAGIQNLRLNGTTRCVSTESPMKADPDVAVGGRLRLVDFITGNELYSSSNQNGDGVVSVTAKRFNATPNRLLKTKYHSNIELPVPSCIGGNCQVAWVVVRNKNVNTGTKVPCHATNAQVLGSTLDCEVDSRPFNQITVN